MEKSKQIKYQSRTLPAGMTTEQMEEIFTDRLANLIVQLLDHLHDQKSKNNEKKEEPKI